MAADRRILVIAAVAMVALIGVGVVSAELFTASACEDLVPEPVAAPAAGADVDAVLAQALGALDAETLAGVAGGLTALAGPGGESSAAADVGDAGSLRELGGDTVAVGERLTVLEGPGEVGDAVTMPDATVVGDGERLFAVALVNELTGQLDAISAIDTSLEPDVCLDTAQVGVPLAFHLDAGDGELLLFRVEEDAEDPTLELRGADRGLWASSLDLGAGPPGQLAERLTGRLGPTLAVVARRALADDQAPALAAHARENGEPRWAVTSADLAPVAPAGTEALVAEVVHVGEDLVLVAASREGGSGVLLSGLDAEDGSVRWTSGLPADGSPEAVGVLDGQPVLLVPRAGADTGEIDGHGLVRLDPDDGSAAMLDAVDGERAVAAVVGDEAVLAGDGEIRRLGVAEPMSAPLPGVAVVDAMPAGDGVALLLRGSGGGAVVWVSW